MKGKQKMLSFERKMNVNNNNADETQLLHFKSLLIKMI